MKAVFKASAVFECVDPDHVDDHEDVEILVLTHPEEELGGREGRILLMHPRVSLELDLAELRRVLDESRGGAPEANAAAHPATEQEYVAFEDALRQWVHEMSAAGADDVRLTTTVFRIGFDFARDRGLPSVSVAAALLAAHEGASR